MEHNRTRWLHAHECGSSYSLVQECTDWLTVSLTKISPTFCSMNNQFLMSPTPPLEGDSSIPLMWLCVWKELSEKPRRRLLHSLLVPALSLPLAALLLSLLLLDACTALMPCTTVSVPGGSSKVRVSCFRPDRYTGSENLILVFSCFSAMRSANLSRSWSREDKVTENKVR